MSGQNLGVQLFVHGNDPVGRKSFARQLSPRRRHARPLTVIGKKSSRAFRHAVHIADRMQVSRYSVLDHLAQAESSRPLVKVAIAKAKGTAKPTYPIYKIGG